MHSKRREKKIVIYMYILYIYIYTHTHHRCLYSHTVCCFMSCEGCNRLHSHAPTLAARGELHFNELLILVCAPVIIIDLMNIYVPCLKFRDMRRRGEIL